jgi:DNA-directed RNA polymerase subunit H (RpoH/RPB5)
MYSKKQFTALEAMCREQAALSRNEMEYSLMKYWLAEAEEWKQLRQSDPFKERIGNRSGDLARSSSVQVE